MKNYLYYLFISFQIIHVLLAIYLFYLEDFPAEFYPLRSKLNFTFLILFVFSFIIIYIKNKRITWCHFSILINIVLCLYQPFWMYKP